MRKLGLQGLSYLSKVIQLSLTAVVWVLPEAEPKTRVRGQVVGR